MEIEGFTEDHVSPKNAAGATPIIVNGWPSITNVEPTMDLSAP